MDNAYLTNPEDDYETPWYLLKGGIFESFRYDTFESFNDKLWQLLVAITSKRKKDDNEKQRLLETLAKVVLMIKGCHYFLHHKDRLDFKEDWIDIKWLPNPYRCRQKYRSKEDGELNHHLAHFREPFTKLTREEAQNFTIAFQNFFAEMDLSSWLNLMDGWKSCLEGDETLFGWQVDFAPLKTYEKLLVLHEACLLGYHWAELDYPPPNRHLYEYFFDPNYESYRDASPFELIDTVLYEINYDVLRQDILEMYAGCSQQRKGLAMKTDDLRFSLHGLIQTGWLLLQTDYFPADWLDPNSFNFLRCPIPENEVDYWQPKSLSFKESGNLPKTLSRLYYGVEVQDEMYSVDSSIIRYLDTKHTTCWRGENFIARDRLLKTLDILTLIVLDLRKRRTKPDGIIYPVVPSPEQVTSEDKIENNPENL